MRNTLASSEDEVPRPKGIGASALLMSALVLIGCASGLFHLYGASSTRGFRYESLPAFFSYSVLLAAGLYAIWNFWKGKDWARTVAMITSLFIVARSASEIVDHGGSLVPLMSQPLVFLEFVLAVFLLCWLNTRPVRAWYKKASTTAELVTEHLVGKLCTAVARHGEIPNERWRIVFEHDAELTLACPWRIVLDDNLAFASNAAADSSANNGDAPRASEAVDQEEPRRLLQNLRVTAVRVSPGTSDLFVTFEMGIELQTWSEAPHHEQWRFSDPVLTVAANSAGLNSALSSTGFPTGDSGEKD